MIADSSKPAQHPPAKSYTKKVAPLKTNLHITLTPFRNESRVLRETNTLIAQGIVEQIFVMALYEDGLEEHERIDDQRQVWRIKLRSRHWPKNLAMQLCKYVELFWKVSRYARRINIEMVNVHTLALLPIGAWLRLRLGAKLVFDAHELETETIGLGGIRQWLSRLVERALIGFADLVIVVSPTIRDHYRSRYGHRAVVSILNCPEFSPVPPCDILRAKFDIPESSTIFLYLGNLCRGRGIEALLTAFDGRNRPDHVLVVIGYGELASVVQSHAARSSSIHLHSAVPPSQVPEYASSADVGVSLIEDACLSYRYCLPNKLFEYVMAGLPVLVSNLPEMAAVVRENDIGEIAYDLDASGINDAIRRLIEKDRSVLKANLRAAAQRFSWERQADEMARCYREYVLSRA